MGKKAKRAIRPVAAVATGGLSEVGGLRTLASSNRLAGLFGLDVVDPDKPPDANIQEAKEIAASRSEELKKRKRVNLLTSPGGALLTAESLAKPSLQLGQ